MKRYLLTNLGVVISIVFFVLKLWAGLISGSIAVISDALNSFLDVFSYSIINISVRLQNQAPDRTHPFGHYRAEPLASFIISLVSVMLGGNIVKDAIVSFFTKKPIVYSPIPLIVLGVAIVTKIVMALFFNFEGKNSNSPALKAAAIDSRNDILASLTAVTGFWLSPTWDSIAALLIGIWVIYSGFKLGMNNIGYLIGEAPDEAFINKVKAFSLRVPGVMGLNDVRAHFVGSYVHVEVHIEVDPNLKVGQAHDIGERVRQELLSIQDVDTVFVHIDVMGDPTRIPLQ